MSYPDCKCESCFREWVAGELKSIDSFYELISRQLLSAHNKLDLVLNKLEPDNEFGGAGGPIPLDRSSARAAILNTVMIAYSNGKIVVPESDDIPF